jgi:hypothetical protein
MFGDTLTGYLKGSTALLVDLRIRSSEIVTRFQAQDALSSIYSQSSKKKIIKLCRVYRGTAHHTSCFTDCQLGRST